MVECFQVKIAISIHAPTRGATGAGYRLGIDALFQSTLPREERLCSGRICSICFRISIHAPTRGATFFLLLLRFFDIISIHAPTRGATRALLTIIGRSKFQSTLPREERQIIVEYSLVSGEFQSTLPREERHQCNSCMCLCVYFNPRSHERSDRFAVVEQPCDDISIHAPTRGATRMSDPVRMQSVFQSTLPREERQIIVEYSLVSGEFQSTLPREERP